MGLYIVDCPQCGQKFEWFSSDVIQLCASCKNLGLNRKRKEANLTILNQLKALVETYPSLRFHQLLQVSNIQDKEDRFYEEPWDTLKRMIGE